MKTTIRFEQKDTVGHIVLCDPPNNLIHTRFAADMREAVRLASESDIRVLLVRSEGPNFSQGGDVLDFLKMEFRAWRTFISDVHHTFRAIEAFQIPTVAVVRGGCLGGAFELALACDFIVAAENCSFRHIEASVGSAPLSGGVQRIAERAGRAHAARITMLSEPLSGKRAGELGIASFVVPEEQAESTGADLAARLANGPTKSYEAIRALLKAWSAGGVPGADSVMIDLTMGLHGSEDARAGRTARSEALKRGVEPEPVKFKGR